MASPYPYLFSEWRLGPLTLKNRIVLSAMTTGFGFDEGVPNQQVIEYFAARSQGVAVATVAFGAVAAEGRVELKLPWMWKADAAEFMAPLAAAIRASGAAPSLQLGHGGRQVSPRVIGGTPVAPSPVKPERHVDELPRVLGTDEIQRIIDGFAAAAVAAESAGYDAVEVHAAHGYLIQQFLAAGSNRRQDAYGQDRTRFGCEVIGAVSAAAPGLAIVVRLNGSDLISGGLTEADAVEAARRFVDAGAHALLVSAGVYGSVPYTIPLLDDDEGLFLHLAAHVKDAVSVPVIGVGRITHPETAEAAIADERVDAVAVGRALLADPDWVAKAERGATADIRPCIATVQGCAGMLQHGNPISCAVNPEVGREGRQPAPAASQEVEVIGGGPAGMEAARRAAELGHKVVLFEKAPRLGGQLRWAACTPPLRHFERLIAWYEGQIERLDVAVRLATVAPDAGSVNRIIATGAVADLPALDGFDVLPTWTIEGLYSGAAATTGVAEPSGRIALIGYGQRTWATALWLAQAHDVIVIADAPPLRDSSGLARHAFLARADAAGVARMRGRVTRARPDGVVLADGGFVECDSMVLVDPLRPDFPAAATGVRVGDALAVGGVAEAISSGRQAAEAIG